MAEFQYGGQAVIEGVMMRGRRSYAVAVRKPSQEIVVDRRPVGSYSQKLRILRWPLIRGTVVLIESLVVGMQSLMFAANQVADDQGEELSPFELSMTLLLAFGLFFALFIALPNVAAAWLQARMPERILLVNLAEGLLRIVVFLAYIVGISRIRDIERVFEYHGAEHKVIHTYESKEALTVANARRHSRLHPRCGTSFLLIVMVISVVIFSLLGRQAFLMRLLTRVILLPVVAGVSYEVLKFSANKRFARLVSWMTYPGLMLQKLTTRDADDSQLEVAIRALERVLQDDTENVLSVG